MTVAPTIIILHGDDNDAIQYESAQLIQTQSQSGLGDLNFSRLDGKNLADEAFSNAVFAMPFCALRRVVMLRNPLSLGGGRDGNQKFIQLLDSIPPTTELWLILPDQIERRDWALFGKSSALRKWAEKNSAKVKILECKKPELRMMPAWILKKTAEMGGKIESAAAQAIVSSIGNDTRQAVKELEKLLLYTDYQRPIDVQDVAEMVAGTATVSIFDMIDALVIGNAPSALRLLHKLLDDQEIPALFAMILRQFRLLVQVKEILAEGGGKSGIAQELHQPDFAIDKLIRQANAFSQTQLADIYQSLLQFDLDYKTGQSVPIAALDVFVTNIALMLRKSA